MTDVGLTVDGLDRFSIRTMGIPAKRPDARKNDEHSFRDSRLDLEKWRRYPRADEPFRSEWFIGTFSVATEEVGLSGGRRQLPFNSLSNTLDKLLVDKNLRQIVFSDRNCVRSMWIHRSSDCYAGRFRFEFGGH